VTEYSSYDTDGQRATRTRGSVTTVYLDNQWEETASGAQRVNYSFNGEVAGYSNGGGWYTLHGDHLGSATWQFNASGGQVGGQEYHPWGVVSAATGTLLSESFNDTGQRRDETGLLYYHARSYDPAIGRFVSADSVVSGAGALTVAPSDATAAAAWAAGGGGPADPQALNRYSYVNNNPVNQIDPTGHVAPIRCPAPDCRWRHNISAWNDFEKGAAVVACLVAGCSVDFEHNVIVGPTPSEQLAGMIPGGVTAGGSANVLKNVVKPFDIVTYGTKVTGFEMHHGVLDVWASANIKRYVSRGVDTPAIALTKAQHDAT
jgi:RHS repeat-associated protein